MINNEQVLQESAREQTIDWGPDPAYGRSALGLDKTWPKPTPTSKTDTDHGTVPGAKLNSRTDYLPEVPSADSFLTRLPPLAPQDNLRIIRTHEGSRPLTSDGLKAIRD